MNALVSRSYKFHSLIPLSPSLSHSNQSHRIQVAHYLTAGRLYQFIFKFNSMNTGWFVLNFVHVSVYVCEKTISPKVQPILNQKEKGEFLIVEFSIES